MVSYALSNTHHSDCFLIKDTIEFPTLFSDLSQIQPSISHILDIEDTPLELDLLNNKLLLTDKPTSILNYTPEGVSNQFRPRISMSERYDNLTIKAKNDRLQNYKIKGEYYNGHMFTPVSILIDTGANANYISHKLCQNLPTYTLECPHQYVNFNGELHEIKEAVETFIKFGSEQLNIRLLIENEGMNDTLEIMLGITFLDSVKPYQINPYGIKITYHNKTIYIPK